MSEDEEDFLSVRQVELYGRFGTAPSGEELERFFFLDDEDRRLIARRRDDSTRLGLALQLTTVRFLGTFLANPIDVPVVVVVESPCWVGGTLSTVGYASRRPAA